MNKPSQKKVDRFHIVFKRRGSAMVLAMFAVALLLIVGTGLLSLGLSRRIFSTRIASGMAARSAADTGLTEALYEMNNKLNIKPWDSNSLPLAINSALPNCNSVFDYTISGDLVSGYTIESVGTYNYSERKVQCALKLQGPFEYAMFGVNGLDLKYSALIDWYNYDENDKNMKVGTNSTELGAITLKNYATINGDVVGGPGANPDDVIDSKDTVTITGDTMAMSYENELLPVVMPEWLESSPSWGTLEYSEQVGTSRRYEEIDLKNSEELNIIGNVTLYVAGDLILDNYAKIVIDENASLILYLQGRLEGKNSSSFNNDTQDPKKLQIYGLDSCEEMIFKNSSEFYGVIYAPNANVTFNNSADAYGSIIAGKFVQMNSAKFSYDASLREKVFADDQAVRFIVNQWSEE